MINDNSNLNSRTEDSNLSSSSGNTRSQSSETVNVQGVEFTKEEIEQANKPQPNVIASTVDHGAVVSGTGTRDNERVNERANEASDSTDTNTGGIVAGAAKGANQS